MREKKKNKINSNVTYCSFIQSTNWIGMNGKSWFGSVVPFIPHDMLSSEWSKTWRTEKRKQQRQQQTKEALAKNHTIVWCLSNSKIVTSRKIWLNIRHILLCQDNYTKVKLYKTFLKCRIGLNNLWMHWEL